MLFKTIAAGLACTVSFAAAWTQPTGSGPEGNPIYTPITGVVVPAGQPYEITWGPTTNGTVTLLLLKGPSTNAVPQYAIVQHIANSGMYSWTPSTDLAPGETGYGIELIDDATGQYQYSTQFGISNADYSGSANSTSSTGSSSSWTSTTWGNNSTFTSTTSSASMSSPASATMASTTTSATSNGASTSAAATTTAAMTSAPAATGAASTVASSFVGLVMAAGVAVFAL